MTDRTPSALERAIAAQRAAVDAGDLRAIGQLSDAYAAIRERLIPLANAAADRVAALQAAGVDPSDMLAALNADARYQTLISQTEREMLRLAAYADDVIRTQQATMVGQALEQSRVLAAVSGGSGQVAARVMATWVRLPTGAVQELVGSLADGSPLRSLLRTLVPNAASAIERELIAGLGRGIGPRAIADLIVKQVDIQQARALLISRDAIVGAHRRAGQRSMIANKGLLQGYIRVCAKQGRTCAACLALDQTVSDVADVMELHPACRCAAMPWLKETDRPALESGADWFARQPAKTQDGILGLQAGAAYRSGELQLGDFVQRSTSDQWGPQVRQGSLIGARQNATARGRMAA